MAVSLTNDNGALVCQFNAETIRIEAHGPHALRVRARPGREIKEMAWQALLPVSDCPAPDDVELTIDTIDTSAHNAHHARLRCGEITAEVRLTGRYGADVKQELVIRFVRSSTGEELLSECRSHFAGPGTRAFKALASDSYKLEATFSAYEGEQLYGLGQPQHGLLDLKGVSTTLLQQNTHVAIPFVLSSRGYGFLWHNPAVGRVEFAANLTRWSAESTSQLDYWITAGDSPADILRRYHDATGHSPLLPDWATGFWQCRLRYRTQHDLVETAREHHRRGLPLSCIVIDFFHWTRQGEWRFDASEWPDPAGMVQDLAAIGVRTMVSIWPTVSASSVHYREMRENGYLLRTERGQPVVIPFPDKDPLGAGFFTYYDASLEEARQFVWGLVQANYAAHGITNFWLDACEPEMRPNHPENTRLAMGNGAEMLNAYPLLHQQGFREGLDSMGSSTSADSVLLCRSAWVGSQKHGVILWSGDVWSNWHDFRCQIAAGLHAGISGMGWWSADVGGFYDGIGKDAAFRELLVRWFQFCVFTPILRLHGFRVPDALPLPADGVPTYGVDTQAVFIEGGGCNEVWSFGEEVYAILRQQLALRERLRPYLGRLMATYSETGAPPMAALFYHFPADQAAWSARDVFLLGPDILVAPVVQAACQSRAVYLPAGCSWQCVATGKLHKGGQTIQAEVSMQAIPVYVREGASVLDDFGHFQANFTH